MDRMLHSVNDATTVRHQGRAWQVIKAITNASERGRQTNSRNDVVIKAANGSVIIPPEAQAAELAEFYGVLYNEVNSVRAEALSTLPTIDSTSISAATPITVEEVHRALKLLKQKKAADPNGIRNEHLKYAGPVFTSVLVKFIMKGWSLGIPESFKVFDLIVSLPKKGDFAMPKNRRGIQIANKFYQIISSILAQRLRNGNEERLHESQAGFRLKPGCRDQRFSFQDIIDAAIERSKPLFVALIDIEKAFDSVDRPALLEIMRSAGVEEDLIDVADDLHSGTSARVRWRGHRSAEFSTSSGVQQGSAASNPEWNLVADVLTRQIQEAVEPHGGIQLFSKATSRTLTLGSTPLPDSVIVKILMLLLADDIASFSKDEAELDFLLQRINSICNRWGLKVSIDKTNILVIAGSDRPLDPHISINGEEIKVVENAKYLGSWYSNDGSIEKEINVRVGAAWGAVRKLGTVLRSRKVSIKAKLRLYHSLVIPILTYGAESWPLTAALTAKLEHFHQCQLRAILGISWRDIIVWYHTRRFMNG
ncbi:putative LINE-1 retrotransposable element ORF2 protein [Nannochloris sp. 'desiccata']|nr:putative LINE-1 retrotransposable element ORF2 protein [Chlorella desiccata (nom. nud.)]